MTFQRGIHLGIRKTGKINFLQVRTRKRKAILNYFCYIEMLSTLDIIMSKKKKKYQKSNNFKENTRAINDQHFRAAYYLQMKIIWSAIILMLTKLNFTKMRLNFSKSYLSSLSMCQIIKSLLEIIIIITVIILNHLFLDQLFICI